MRSRGVRMTAAALLTCALFVPTGCVSMRSRVTSALGAARTVAHPLAEGPMSIPKSPRTEAADGNNSGGVPTTVSALIETWAARDLPSWKEQGKVTAPRILLAKLALGVDVDDVNSYLRAARPWAKIGSTWGLRPNGDYDFSLPPLTAILYLYGGSPHDVSSDGGKPLLDADTVEHLLSVLLNQDGPGFRTTVPGSLGLVTETENHILMIEGSRYLKNQWLRRHGNEDPRFDNRQNGLESALVQFIREIDAAGPYEFNSSPYFGYTAMALLTLEAFAAEPVASAARELLDRMNYEYALGSYGLRRYAPFRRQPRRASITDLTDHPHTAMMRVWVAQATGIPLSIDNNTHQALYAALMPYRLPVRTAAVAARGASVPGGTSTDDEAQTSQTTKPAHGIEYFVRVGRGPGASPELYSGGPGYLLSAGGTGRSASSLIVARPIVLFADDGARDLSHTFMIGSEGDHHSWNNTGVLHRFSVGRSPLSVPAQYSAIAAGDLWRVYAAGEGQRILLAVCDTGRVAALYVASEAFPCDSAPGADRGRGRATSNSVALSEQAEKLLRFLEDRNPAYVVDAGQIHLPDGRHVSFDLDAGADEWVVVSVDGEATDRKLPNWPRLDGWVIEGN